MHDLAIIKQTQILSRSRKAFHININHDAAVSDTAALSVNSLHVALSQ